MTTKHYLGALLNSYYINGILYFEEKMGQFKKINKCFKISN